MKNTTILLLALLAFSCSKKTETTDTGQSNMVWVKQNSGTTMDLYSVDFPSRDTGYAAGNQKICKTSDGGATWKGLVLNNTGTLRSVCFPDAFTGYAVGDSGVILKTILGKTGEIYRVIRNRQ